MASVTGTVSGSLKATITNTSGVPGGGSYSLTPSIEPGTLSLANGTGTNQIDTSYFARLTPSTNGSSVDLSGSLTDPLANTSVFAELAAFQVANRGSNSVALTGNLISSNFGGGTSGITIPASGWIQVCLPGAAGWAVTNAASDTLTVTGVGGTSIADVGFVGRSA
jgi:hypothetical protein